MVLKSLHYRVLHMLSAPETSVPPLLSRSSPREPGTEPGTWWWVKRVEPGTHPLRLTSLVYPILFIF